MKIIGYIGEILVSLSIIILVFMLSIIVCDTFIKIYEIKSDWLKLLICLATYIGAGETAYKITTSNNKK